MASTITYDHHHPTKIGNLAVITGKLVISSYTTGGEDFSSIERQFEDGLVYAVLFEVVDSSGTLITTMYDRTNKKAFCHAAAAAELTSTTALTTRFVAIGQGGLRDEF